MLNCAFCGVPLTDWVVWDGFAYCGTCAYWRCANCGEDAVDHGWDNDTNLEKCLFDSTVFVSIASVGRKSVRSDVL